MGQESKCLNPIVMVKYIRVFFQIIILYLFYLLGSLIVQLLGIHFPGSIVGLILLFLMLRMKLVPVELIRDGAGFLLALLPLFFVPATVGVINYPQLLSTQGILLLLTVVVSTIITIIISGKICQYIEVKMQKGEAEQ